jgi:outer membrane receptor protein involved in Fe transport
VAAGIALAVAGAAVPSLHQPLQAQVPDSTRDSIVVLPTVEVRASIVPAAAPSVGSGVPASVTVVEREAITGWEPRLAADVLGAQAGVSLYDDLGTPYKLNLTMRGFSAGPTVGLPPGVSVFLDGVRQNEPDAAEVNFDLLPLEHVERIELLRGTGSLLGPNSLGGAVNLVTRRGRGPIEAEIEASGGSFGAGSAGVSVGGGAPEGWDWYAAGGWDREGGWREATGAERWQAFANAGRHGARSGLRVQALASASRAETAGSLPESIFRVAPRTNFTAGDFEDLDAQQLSVSGYAQAAAGRATFTAWIRRSDAERFNVNQAPDDNVRALTRNHGLGATVDWRTAGRLGAASTAVRLGADAGLRRTRVRLFEEEFDEPDQRTLTTEVESPGWDLAGYVLGDLGLGRLTLAGGLRWDRVVVPFRDILDPGADTTSSFARLSPRLGASLDLGGGVAVHASVGRAFRAPVVLELACADPEAACPLPFALGDDPPLDPVVATTLEAGARWEAGPLLLTASAYRTSVRDEIVFVASEAARLAGYFTNLSRTRREGVEVAAASAPAPWLSAWASWAWTRATFRGPAELFSIRAEEEFASSPLAGGNAVEAGDRLPLVPDHQVKAGGVVRLPAGLSVGLDVRYTGRQWLRADEANETARLDGHLAANARVALAAGGWELAGIVTNLLGSDAAIFGTFNENRRTGELERFLTPMQARAVTLVLRRRFGG